MYPSRTMGAIQRGHKIDQELKFTCLRIKISTYVIADVLRDMRTWSLIQSQAMIARKNQFFNDTLLRY